MYIPVLGRLTIADYVRIALAFTFLITEPFIRLFFFLFPVANVMNWLRKWFPQQPPDGSTPIDYLQTSEDFVRYWGFPFEPHYVTTKDGYIICLHRIPHGRDSLHSTNGSPRRLNRSHPPPSPSTPRPVVLLWHGFLMCSEVFVCTPDPTASLAFTLAEAGYDVWLGNTRGNKYSCKHKTLKPTQEAFWDFSLDSLAMYDMPDAVDYILRISGAPSLSYIGFSQGTAQGFSALSLNRKLCKQVNLFIALAPATKPHALASKTINALINSAPEVIYLLFGRKALISSTLFWQSVLSPHIFSFVIDQCMWLLFGWKSKHIPHKHIVYRHLYSYTSVKTVVHWFQVMRTRKFQMYDEEPTIVPGSTGGHLVPKFPTEGITTPVAIIYGGLDTIPDVEYILRETPTPVFCMQVDEYEHLHFLWGALLHRTVYPAVLGLLNSYAEIWSDPSSTSPTNSITTTTSEPTRSVPWIPKAEIEKAIKLGRGRSSSRGTVFEGRISIEELWTHDRLVELGKQGIAPPSYEEVAGMSNKPILANQPYRDESISLARGGSSSSSDTPRVSEPTSETAATSLKHNSSMDSESDTASIASHTPSSIHYGSSTPQPSVSTFHTMMNNPSIAAAVARLSSSSSSGFNRRPQRTHSIGGIPQSSRPGPLVKADPTWEEGDDDVVESLFENDDGEDAFHDVSD
ncbi:hypothetical protein SmJEL517_g00727 [Synchytrium microbalum]|uniref:Partial AB-hydrolase lipase domain-containing protein n=1 Tax=Synchytrium microbalum TaxID=1806994 RepID=A0A507CD11_9FUNG|nr:uncharacterized protein SmJEL517_g00727 [Synchytrium microbalum]TPX37502.1 hypothetical protein SmJEL517_g00727 [Synchytrium microbalum]